MNDVRHLCRKVKSSPYQNELESGEIFRMISKFKREGEKMRWGNKSHNGCEAVSSLKTKPKGVFEMILERKESLKKVFEGVGKPNVRVSAKNLTLLCGCGCVGALIITYTVRVVVGIVTENGFKRLGNDLAVHFNLKHSKEESIKVLLKETLPKTIEQISKSTLEEYLFGDKYEQNLKRILSEVMEKMEEAKKKKKNETSSEEGVKGKKGWLVTVATTYCGGSTHNLVKTYNDEKRMKAEGELNNYKKLLNSSLEQMMGYPVGGGQA